MFSQSGHRDLARDRPNQPVFPWAAGYADQQKTGERTARRTSAEELNTRDVKEKMGILFSRFFRTDHKFVTKS